MSRVLHSASFTDPRSQSMAVRQDHEPEVASVRPGPGWIAIALGLAAIYFIWGSTFLAIRVALETLPPLALAGTRFVVAGAILYGLLRATVAARPATASWWPAAALGLVLIGGSNGLISWAQQWVPSGMAALIVATIPLWMSLVDWSIFGGVRPRRALILGLGLGFAGVALLMDPGHLARHGIPPAALAAMIVSPVLWTLGSLWQARKMRSREPALMNAAMQMLCGGASLLILSLATGELAGFDASQASLRSVAALGYLIVAGSVIAYSAYTWLLTVASPAVVGTYAYVNPLVAVALGTFLAHEPVSLRMLAAAALIVGAVALAMLGRRTSWRGSFGSRDALASGKTQSAESQRPCPTGWPSNQEVGN